MSEPYFGPVLCEQPQPSSIYHYHPMYFDHEVVVADSDFKPQLYTSAPGPVHPAERCH